MTMFNSSIRFSDLVNQVACQVRESTVIETVMEPKGYDDKLAAARDYLNRRGIALINTAPVVLG